jgi:F0F1-type ATP synthase assembly protein I
MRSSWSSGLELATVGITLVVATALGYAGGVWVDHRLGTGPVGSAIGVLLGAAAGFVELFRVVGAASRRDGGDDGEG